MNSGAAALVGPRAIRNIVAPYDFSPRCQTAARYALDFARHYQAQLTFTHVIPFSSFEYTAFEGGAYVGANWPSEDETRDRMQAELGELDATDSEQSSWRLEVLKGDPAEKIAQLVGEREAPFIVMPTHGYGAFRRFILGSVTTKLLHEVPCPVLTGAHLEEGEAFPQKSCARVACAVNLGQKSIATLQWAKEFADSWSAELVVLHALDALEHSPVDSSFFTPDLRRQLLEAAQKKVDELFAQAGLTGTKSEIGFGASTDFVPDRIRKQSGDILIIGRRSGASLIGSARSHTYGLIRAAPCPVISV